MTNVTFYNLAAPKTQNAKLGKGVATNYRPVGDSSQGLGTCPPTCKMLNNGCYAQTSFTGMHQRNANTRFDPVDKLLKGGAKFVRLHTSGDFFIPDGQGGYILDLAYWTAIVNLANENPDVTIWTYCHDVSKFVDFDISYAKGNIPANLHITASVDTLELREYAKLHGFRTARVIPGKDDKVKGETLCPYDYQISQGKKRTINCVDCKLCFNPAHLNDIAFIQH